MDADSQSAAAPHFFSMTMISSRVRAAIRYAIDAVGFRPVVQYLRGTPPPAAITAAEPAVAAAAVAAPAVLEVPAAPAAPEDSTAPSTVEPDYDARIAAEIATFTDDEIVHDLPAIFHYWSNKYLLPKIQAFGFSHPDDFFVKQFAAVMAHSDAQETHHFISIGAGNCDTEVRIAKTLIAQGLSRFTIECLELNPAMIERGRLLAATEGVAAHIIPVVGDFNAWTPDKHYHAVMANQSLHHVMNLEGLFDAIARAIHGFEGVLITSDMIGRNGHQRWPEALAIVEEYWQALAPRYRYNHQLRRQEDSFVNWDCSVEGFEGIRAQDILALLVERFHFDLFVPFANVITPFIDRGFGPNFDVERAEDRALIDEIHKRDEREMAAGCITPTQMFAVLSLDHARPSKAPSGMSPNDCIRRV